MKHIIAWVTKLKNRLFPFGSPQENNSKFELNECPSVNQKIEDVIRGYFDKQEWKYRMYTNEDSVITFKLGFSGGNERLMVYVNVFTDEAVYQIGCRSDTKLSQEVIRNGRLAMNNYNIVAKVVSGCIGLDGSIMFWLGRNIDGNTFSEKAFAVDFIMVMNVTDNETAQIYKQAFMDK